MFKGHSAPSRPSVCSYTRRIDHRQTHVALHNIGTGGGQIPNINARSCWIGHRDLNRRVTDDQVPGDDVPFDAGDESDSIRVADYCVLYDDIVGHAWSNQTDAEIVTVG